MKLEPEEERLFEAFKEIPVVDAHEHLQPEKVRTSQHMDVFDLFVHYTRTDFLCAGMTDEQWNQMHKPEIPQEKRWRILSKYLKEIRYGSYARPAFIYAKHLGYDDITERNYKAISERLQADNKPGIYRKIMVEMCNIKAALSQARRTDFDLDFMIPVMPMDMYDDVRSWDVVEKRASDLGEKANTIDDYLEVARKGLKKWIKEGTVGLKMVSRAYCPPDRNQAVGLFDELKHKADRKLPDMNPLRDYLMEQLLDLASELGLVVAVHTGMWGDFRTLDPKHMISIFGRHPKTKFDMYHMGMPWVREAGVIGKNFPNVWLNLCWCHVISPEMTCSALNEWIDLVPMNKIIGFGGDYGKPVEKVYGHLMMAREDTARVLGGRVKRGLMTEDEALGIARKWFYQNPKQLYGLRV